MPAASRADRVTRDLAGRVAPTFRRRGALLAATVCGSSGGWQVAQWRDVLDDVVEHRRAALVGYACLYVVDRRDAEDLVHEAIVRTFARPRVVTDPHAAEGYVRAAIRSVFLDGIRRQRGWRERMPLLRDDTDAPAAEHAAAAGVDVRSALALLAPRERACVALRYFDDLPVRDIAAELGIGEGAVKRYLSDGTRKLRDVLGVAVPADPGTAERITITPVGGSDA